MTTGGRASGIIADNNYLMMSNLDAQPHPVRARVRVKREIAARQADSNGNDNDDATGNSAAEAQGCGSYYDGYQADVKPYARIPNDDSDAAAGSVSGSTNHVNNDHNDNDNDDSGASNEQEETDEELAVHSVAPRGSRGPSQVVLQGVVVDVPVVSVAPPVRPSRRRARRRDAGEDCVASRTRARSGRRFAHRTSGVRATRSRVRAGDAVLVAGLD